MTAAPEDIAALNSRIHGFKLSRMLGLVANLGIADFIAVDQAVPAQKLATSCNVLTDPLLRICRALTSFGIFTVSAGDMIGHSRQSVLLRTDSTPSLGHAAKLFMAPAEWGAWGALDQAMQGATPFEVLWDTGRFPYLRAHPDQGRLFDDVMANSADNRLNAVAEAYDFSTASTIVDIGGGNGALLRAILTCYSGPTGVVFDCDDVLSAIPVADRLNGRITAITGDFFQQAPPAADIYLLSWILHDWPDQECLHILRNCRSGMRPEARLLVVERLLDTDPAEANPMDYLADIQMMVDHGSRERTQPEFQRLLTQAGFGPIRLFRTASSVWVIECTAT